MESLVGLGHGPGAVGVLAVAVASVLAGVMFLVFRMSPGTNYEEVFRKQREQLMAMDEPKQKRKDKPTKRNKDKAKEKKDRSATPTQASATASPTATSTGSETAIEDKIDSSVPNPAINVRTQTAKDSALGAATPSGVAGLKQHHSHHHHEHVDFAEKEDVKLVELDQPPKVEPGKVLASNRQPGRPILVHSEVSISAAGETTTSNDVTVTSRVPFVRSNSFKDLRPMDEVELHHKKQQSPAKSLSSKASSKEAKEQKDEKLIKEDKVPQTVASPKKKEQQQQTSKEQQLSQGATKKENVESVCGLSGGTTVVSPATVKKCSPQHEASGGRKERKVFSKKELRELINQIEQNELPPDMGEDTIQHLVDALLNHQNDSKEWRSTRQDPMQQLKRNLQEKEDQVVHLSEQLNNSLARGKEIHAEMAHWKTRCSQTQGALLAAENKVREEAARFNAETQRAMRVEDQLRETQGAVDQLRSRIHSLEARNNELQATIKREKEIATSEKEALSQNATAEMEQTRKELEKTRLELDQTRAELEKIRKSSSDQLDVEKRQFEGRLKQTEAEVAKLQQTLRDTQTQLDQSKKEIAAARGAQEASSGAMDRLVQQTTKLKDELEQLRTRNNQLNEKNWATVEAMNEVEQKYRDLHAEQSKERKSLLEGLPKSAQTSIKDIDGENFVSLFVAQLTILADETDKVKAEIESLRRSHATVEAELQEVTAAKDAAVAAARQEVQAHVALLSKENSEELDSLREESVRLRAENAHYSSVLSKTEKILQNLQDSVEGEEKRWAEDRARFETERSEMSAVVRELELKLKELQEQLEYAEVEKSNAQIQLNSCRADLDKANKQLAAVADRAAQDTTAKSAQSPSIAAVQPESASPESDNSSIGQVTSTFAGHPAPAAATSIQTATSFAAQPDEAVAQQPNGQSPPQREQPAVQPAQQNGSEDSSPSPTHSCGSGQANGGGAGHDGEGEIDAGDADKTKKKAKKKRAKKVR
ncbi:cingulin-like isoform X2 [Varroa destructor]|uniref:Ribosome-binding protein 1 n=1 Tax=Varroa destructor TaxID=109461 RepID=A0A7M7JLG0_VARDE|nr:cingulin-like isoform X2 [Varroa destructor]